MKRLVFGLAVAALVAGCECFNGGEDASWRDAERPLINAHRGSRAEYDDNAAGGFRKCLENGIRGFETDVRITKDDELVIMHDSDVSRTTLGQGKVGEMTLAEVTALKLKRSGENVPTPKDIAEIFRGVGGIRFEWEMKESAEALGESRGAVYVDKLYEIVSKTMVKGTYRFTSFNASTLKLMKARHPDAKIGYITGGALSRKFVDEAVAMGCSAVAPRIVSKGGAVTSFETMEYARSKGLETTPWMNQNYRDLAMIYARGGDTGTSDHAMELQKKQRAKRRLICLDLDATLCQHRSPIPPANLEALKELMKRYKCVMVGAGNAPRIHKQMEGFPIDIIGNYGMQEALGEDGNFRIVRAVTNTVDRKFFREKTDYLRQKYGYTQYEGEPLEFHASGMVTFGLLGTSPSAEHKVKFDPDRKKRRAMYKEVCEIFKDYSVFIGGSTSFDFAGKKYNKYDAIMDYAKRHGYSKDEIVFIGDDFGDGGGDSHVRLKGMDYIEIHDYRDFPREIAILLK